VIVPFTVKPLLLETPRMVTLFEETLCAFPVAVAFAVIVVLADKDNPVTVHVPVDVVVVVPRTVAPLRSCIVVPVASTEVPETLETVLDVQYDPVITGASVVPPEADVTVTLDDAFERQFAPEIAFAVMICPDKNVNPVIVQFVPLAIVEPMLVEPA
jgi:hypothetical protein